jgi:hypothetical protein
MNVVHYKKLAMNLVFLFKNSYTMIFILLSMLASNIISSKSVHLAGKMERRHQDILQSNTVFLLDNLSLNDSHMLDYLYTDGLLMLPELNTIEVGIYSFF